MKRNLDTVRKLLEIFEEIPAGEVQMMIPAGTFEVDNSPVEIIEHIELMIEAGLLEGEVQPDSRDKYGGIFTVRKLTWSGHDFLNAARNDDVWNITKRKINKVGSWTFGLVLDLLKEEAKRRLQLS